MTTWFFFSHEQVISKTDRLIGVCDFFFVLADVSTCLFPEVRFW